MKLTSKHLQNLIEQEVAKFSKRKKVKEAKFGKEKDVETAVKDTEEVDADEYADTLEKDIDWLAALKIEEGRTIRRLKKIRESRKVMLKKISKKSKK